MVVNIVRAVVSIVSVVVLMVVENVLRVDQTLPSYQCRTAVVLISYWQSWTDKDRELRPRSDGFATIMTDRGGLLWSGTSAKNDRHSVTWASKIRGSHDSLIINMGIPIPGKDSLYIETGPRIVLEESLTRYMVSIASIVNFLSKSYTEISVKCLVIMNDCWRSGIPFYNMSCYFLNFHFS